MRRNALALGIVIGILPMAAQAYVGPGSGLTAIGIMVALLAIIVLAVIGFIWYPIKRLVNANKTPSEPTESAETPK